MSDLFWAYITVAQSKLNSTLLKNDHLHLNFNLAKECDFWHIDSSDYEKSIDR